MADLNIKKLQSPYLREFFQDVFDGTAELEGISVQADGTSVPIAFATSAPVNAVAAQGTLTFTDSVSDTETVTIGDDVYEFDTDGTEDITEGNIRVDVSGGATASDAVTALVTAITGNTEATYSAVDGDGDTVVVTYETKGTVGNSVEVETDCADASWGSEVATLGDTTEGVDGTVAVKGQMYADASYLYFAVADNATDDTNWRRVSLGSAY
jgi:hypothetical protein